MPTRQDLVAIVFGLIDEDAACAWNEHGDPLDLLAMADRLERDGPDRRS